MKRLWLLLLALVLLLSLCGCKQELPDDDAIFGAADTGMTEVTDSAQERVEQTEPKEELTVQDTVIDPSDDQQSTSGQEGTENTQSTQTNGTADSAPKEELPDYFEMYYTKLSAEQLAGLDTVKESFEETIYRFDRDLFSNMRPYQNPLVCFGPSDETIEYSSLMESLGSDGILVAGYATGLRESHRKPSDSYILTQFTVTDVYYGTETAKTITIRERYHLNVEQGYGQFYYTSGYTETPPLKNDKQVLLYLKKHEKTGYYTPAFAQIPLQEDYKNYNEAYLNSLLGFFRGDKAEYPENKNTEIDREAGAVVSPDGSVVYPVPKDGGNVAPVMKKVYYWPEREITNEALLAEMREHVLVQTAVNYKVVIWPYGHKNYTGDSGSSNFHKVCRPQS